MMAKPRAKATASATLLVELLTEELPPRALERLGQALATKVKESLASAGLVDPGAELDTFATPRRLAVRAPKVRARAPDTRREVQGPPAGAPAQAVAGFAKKYGVAVGDLKQQETAKGKFYTARVITAGQALADILADRIEAALKALPDTKLMRWGSGDAQFVRPVHGLVMLHGSRIVPGSVLGIESSNRTLGHRFLAGSAIALRHADDYERALRSQGKVIASFAARRALVLKGL